MAMKYKLTPYNLQELGQRQNQEDSLFPGIDQQTQDDRLFILCDGMGGHEKGEVASATVCETMSNCILSRWNPNEVLSDKMLQQAIAEAYDALDTKDNGEAKKMGTTMTIVCFHAGGVTVAHIGDSRVYQLRPATKKEPARIIFKTRDHSLVNDLIDIGEITEDEAKNHPQKNVITRAMQPCQERRAMASIAHLTDIQKGDYFYMCSDGMLEQSTDENILNIITKNGFKDEQKIEMLRSVTEENRDNHTAHLIHIDSVNGCDKESICVSPRGMLTGFQHNKLRKNSILVLSITLIILILAILASFFLKKPSAKGNPDSTEIEVSDVVRNEPIDTHRNNKKSHGLVEHTTIEVAKNNSPEKTSDVENKTTSVHKFINKQK